MRRRQMRSASDDSGGQRQSAWFRCISQGDGMLVDEGFRRTQMQMEAWGGLWPEATRSDERASDEVEQGKWEIKRDSDADEVDNTFRWEVKNFWPDDGIHVQMREHQMECCTEGKKQPREKRGSWGSNPGPRHCMWGERPVELLVHSFTNMLPQVII